MGDYGRYPEKKRGPGDYIYDDPKRTRTSVKPPVPAYAPPAPFPSDQPAWPPAPVGYPGTAWYPPEAGYDERPLESRPESYSLEHPVDPATYDYQQYASYPPQPFPHPEEQFQPYQQSPYPTYSDPYAPQTYEAPPPSPFAPTSSRGRVPCRHWARSGRCNMGDLCGFGHDGAPGQTPPGIVAPRPVPQGPPRAKRVPCRHFSTKGFCQMGDACNFLHGSPDSAPVSGGSGGVGYPSTGYGGPGHAAPSPVAPSGPRSAVDCRHWLKGHCGLGEACRFSHSAPLGAGGAPGGGSRRSSMSNGSGAKSGPSSNQGPRPDQSAARANPKSGGGSPASTSKAAPGPGRGSTAPRPTKSRG